MSYRIRSVQAGDEIHLAHIQTESWKAAFKDILSTEILQKSTEIHRATAMYKQLLDQHIGYGYILEVNGIPHCIAWWDKSREDDMADYAELICIHSLQDNWRKGYGTKMMEKVLDDIKAAGYTKAMLWVFSDNDRARKFYEAQGFAANGRTKTCFEAEEICYEKNLLIHRAFETEKGVYRKPIHSFFMISKSLPYPAPAFGYISFDFLGMDHSSPRPRRASTFTLLAYSEGVMPVTFLK